jgi:hypothetical protein
MVKNRKEDLTRIHTSYSGPHDLQVAVLSWNETGQNDNVVGL